MNFLDATSVASGEGQSNTNPQFTAVRDWLSLCNIQNEKANQFIEQGYTTVDMFVECSNEDINEIAQEFQLRLPQKLCLKKQINLLKAEKISEHNIISPQEQQQILKMGDKIKSLETFLKSVHLRSEELTIVSNKCKVEIEGTFDKLFQALAERKKYLLNELANIIEEKQQQLKMKDKDISQILQTTRETFKECNLLLRKSIKLETMEQRSKLIDEKSKAVCSLFNTDEESHSLTASNVNFFPHTLKALLVNVSKFGVISGVQPPIIESLTSNGKNFIVCIAYHLNLFPLNLKTEQNLKIEWRTIGNSNEEQEMKMNNSNNNISMSANLKWHEKVLILNESSKINIDVGQRGSYVFRMSHFNGHEWSVESGQKNIILDYDLSDTWDIYCKGSSLTVNGLKVKHAESQKYQCIFGKRIIEKGCHSWRFKVLHIDESQGENWSFVIGITESDKCQSNFNTWLSANKSGYAFVGKVYSDAQKTGMDIEFGLEYPVTYGKELKVGDTIEMIVNLDSHELSYIINGHNYGIGFDQIPNGKRYRMGVTLSHANDEIELLQ